MAKRKIRVVASEKTYNADSLNLITSGGNAKTKRVIKFGTIGMGTGFGYALLRGKNVITSMLFGTLIGVGIGTLVDSFLIKKK